MAIRVMTLNTWFGTRFEELISFLAESADEIDVFCFQEVYHCIEGHCPHPRGARDNLFQEMERVLPRHQGFFFPVLTDMEKPYAYLPISFGTATFVRRNLPIRSCRSEIIHGDPAKFVPGEPLTVPRNLSCVTIQCDGLNILSVCNMHGLWNGYGKTDTVDRLRQARTAKLFLGQVPGRKVLCGDFNLRPDTRSFAILADGMRDLVSECGNTNTRSHTHYSKEERFADYILADSLGMEIEHFQVVQAHGVSDHLPLVVTVLL